MSQSRCTDGNNTTSTWPRVARRSVLLALLSAPLVGCGVKGPLEMPPPEPYEENPNPIENPDTYGDPSTFPESGENEESAE